MAFLLQLPSVLQIEHLLHHEEAYNGAINNYVKNFQKADDLHCLFLHQELNFNYTYPTPFFQIPIVNIPLTKIPFFNRQINTQVLPFAMLRGPPLSFFKYL